MTRSVLVVASLVVAVAGAAAAQERPGPLTLKATRAAVAPVIDGRLDDPAWQNAVRLTEFTQKSPLEGAPVSEPTEVWLAYDASQIYIAVYAHYGDAGLIRANRVDRDRIWNDDRVSVIFDPFLDRQRAYRFAVNGYGVQGDTLIGNGGGTGDISWNALFRSAGAVLADGWTAEMAIPFKSLRYPARAQNEVHRWGFQVEREIAGKDESAVWAPVSRGVMSELGQMGVVDGITNLSTSRNLELLPSVTAVHAGQLDTASGAFRTDSTPDAGLNLKYGLTSNLTLDFTVNPDFSQIESDRPQIEVNQRFPLLYPEQRPFFLEGQEIFRIPGPVTFIHTRTIVDPQFGAKLSGKVGRMTVGLLVANDESPGNLDDRTSPLYGKTAQFVLGRARYDLYPESTMSLIFTDREFMDRFSRATGFDGDFALGPTHRVFARFIFTDHKDAAGVQRKGHFYDINFRKEGRNLGYGLISNAVSPDLRTDVGFVRRVNQRQSLANVSYRWWPEHWIRNWGPRLSFSRNYQYDGTLQDESSGASVSFTFARNITANAGVNRDMERFRNIDFWKSRMSLGGRVATSRRFEIGANFNRGDQVRFIDVPFLGRGTTWDVSVVMRPIARIQSDISLATSGFRDPRTNTDVFDVKIIRALTTYQFTDRLVTRTIFEHNTFDKTLGANVLVTYRVNAGTVFFVGYDDRYRQGDLIGPVFRTSELTRTNRAVFTKFQYLFRR